MVARNKMVIAYLRMLLQARKCWFRQWCLFSGQLFQRNLNLTINIKTHIKKMLSPAIRSLMVWSQTFIFWISTSIQLVSCWFISWMKKYNSLFRKVENLKTEDSWKKAPFVFSITLQYSKLAISMQIFLKKVITTWLRCCWMKTSR